MCKIWFSSLFAEETTQRKASEFFIRKSFRFFGFPKRLSNGQQFFRGARIVGSGLQTQRQQFLGLLELACASLQFSQTQGSRSTKARQPQRFAVSVSRLLLSFEPFIRNSQIVGNFRVTGVSIMRRNKARERLLKAIQASLKSSSGLQQFKAVWEFLQSLRISLGRSQKVAVQFFVFPELQPVVRSSLAFLGDHVRNLRADFDLRLGHPIILTFRLPQQHMDVSIFEFEHEARGAVGNWYFFFPKLLGRQIHFFL